MSLSNLPSTVSNIHEYQEKIKHKMNGKGTIEALREGGEPFLASKTDSVGEFDFRAQNHVNLSSE
jgi:hypothetical protein